MLAAAERRLAGEAALHATGPLRPTPSTVAERDVCADSGLIANAWCPRKRHEWLPVERADVPCSWHHLGDEGLVTVLPAAFEAWQQGQGRVVTVARHDETPVARAGARRRVAASRGSAAFAITSPPDGATYLIDPTLRREDPDAAVAGRGRGVGGDMGTGSDAPSARPTPAARSNGRSRPACTRSQRPTRADARPRRPSPSASGWPPAARPPSNRVWHD